MDSLSDKTSIKMVKKALDALPKGSKALDVAYDGAMQRVNSQLEGYRHLANQLLGWLTYSERLMSVEEIEYALAIEPGESRLDEDNFSDVIEVVGYCAGLVIVEEDNGYTGSLRLVHYTTQEYFRQNSGKHLVDAQQDIAMSCLTYLLYEEFGDGWAYELEEEDDDVYTSYYPCERVAEARLDKYPFLRYAARHWASHASVCEQQAIKNLTMTFARHDHKVSSAGQAMLMVDRNIPFTSVRASSSSPLSVMHETGSSSPLSVMHVLAYIGNKAIFSELLNHGFEADSEDSTRSTPLWWAAQGGQYAMVKFLLSDNHANANNGACHLFDDHACVTSTPLHAAVTQGHTAIVKLLLDCPNIDVNLRDACYETPLHRAVSLNHTPIVKLLLDCADVDVNARDPAGLTPFQFAGFGLESYGPYHKSSYDTSIPKLFCAHPKVDLDSRDEWGGNVIDRVKRSQERRGDWETNEEYEDCRLKLEECLDIIRTAIEHRRHHTTI